MDGMLFIGRDRSQDDVATEAALDRDALLRQQLQQV